ncbi:LysM peptidoglycan-binding domain-containing protein [Nibricoccus sp. IMCC34717]|uniref:LysM peptidoglycan-binding domain-containing protein n=1 Tax=Nibricoccus sp. IMCC34717 TaxID=3034021 RepID=UPI00384DD619
MDTISRENNSMLPLAGVIVGGLAVILSAIALVKLSSVKTELTTFKDETSARISSVESQASSAAATAEATKNLASRIQSDTNTAFGQVAEQLGTLRGEITKIQEAQKAAPKAAGAKGGAPAVAGPGEYIVKAGDTPTKIAKANGTTATALVQVNPGVAWNKLKVGQKLKLPKK